MKRDRNVCFRKSSLELKKTMTDWGNLEIHLTYRGKLRQNKTLRKSKGVLVYLFPTICCCMWGFIFKNSSFRDFLVELQFCKICLTMVVSFESSTRRETEQNKRFASINCQTWCCNNVLRHQCTQLSLLTRSAWAVCPRRSSWSGELPCSRPGPSDDCSSAHPQTSLQLQRIRYYCWKL